MAENLHSESFQGPEEVSTEKEIFIGGTAFKELDKSSLCDIAVDEVHFACNVCHQWHSTLSSLLIHFLDHFTECPTCENCGETFTVARDYADHCITHIGHTCIVCQKEFYSESEYVTHKLEHKLQCIHCMKKFSSAEDLKNHHNRKHYELTYKCEVCCRYYTSQSNLNAHVRFSHTKSETFRCKECNRTFSKKSNLNYHVSRQHRKEKPYTCEVCNRGFPRKRSLDRHMLHHSGEKPYTCLVCSHTFSCRQYFQSHSLTHLRDLTDQSYKCDLCFEVFTKKNKYDYHMKKHLKGGHYKCEMCDQTFNQSSHLKQHKITHHEIHKPFVCEVCEKQFSYRKNLIHHLKIMHSYNEEEIRDIKLLMTQERLMKKAQELECI